MSSKSLIVLLATVVAVAGLLLLTRTVVQLGAPTVRQPSVFEAERGRAPVVWVDTDRGRFYYEAKNARRAPQFP